MEPRKPNRLIGQTSPYLLQHAHNPVDWRPWGDEAFAEARRRDVPIFLSIGYSTCYWCHVMERESFESEAIAALMNERFVCVKVDREERPDVDEIYMAAVQAFTGHGGWPMSVFLEPRSLKPFWAGTYFPPEPKYQNMPSFPHVLESVSEAWREHRDEVLEQAEQLADAVRERVAEAHRPVLIGEQHVTRAVGSLLRMFDRNHGGFGGAPKFPQPVLIDLLLDARRAAGDEATTRAIDAAVRTTLDKMACGGMNDQVGGGFHRYSVDAFWIVPHFEKMLYDNAQLALTYAKAAKVYGDAFYRRTAVRTIEYVLRELAPGGVGARGGFFSAQDAEVEHREGGNYVWTREQIEAALGPEDGVFAARVYGVDKGPNFRDPHRPDEPMTSVLHLPERPETLAASMGMTEAAFLERLDRVNARLYEVRSERKQPTTDDKALASWNGMMIGALAAAGAILDEPRFVKAAGEAADFVLEHLARPSERGGLRLIRTHRAGQSHTAGFLEDYAFVSAGLIELHRTGTDAGGRYLDAARSLIAEARRGFGSADGGFFDTMAGQADLFVRTRSVYDGALPSGVGVMMHALLDLAEITGEKEHRERAVAAMVAVSAAVAQAPVGACNAVRALMRLLATAGPELEHALRDAAAAPAPASPDPDFTPVEVLADTDRVEVGPGRPAKVTLRVRIAEGYHLSAFDPAPGRDSGGLTPFRVHLVSGAGVAVYADYPAGDPYGEKGELRIYRGEVEIPVAIEQQGEWSGRPLMGVTFQPCTEEYCLAARTVELDVAIDQV